MLIDRRRSHNPDPPAPRPSDAIEGEAVPAGLDSGDSHSKHDPHRLLLARVVLVLAVALALSSEALVSTAERQPFGPQRAITLTVAQAVHDQASDHWLDRPARLLRATSGSAGTATSTSTPADETPNDSFGVDVEGQRVEPPAAAPRSPTATATATATATSRESPPETPETTHAGSEQPETLPGEPKATLVEPAPRPIDAANRLRIWAGGDSLGEYIGNHLLAELADEELTSVELDYRISTGLARPDYFDWPSHLAAVTADSPPDVLLLMVGGNDNQNMERDGDVLQAGSEAWSEEYETRIESIVTSADAASTHIVWIGLPPMRDGTRHELALLKNAAAKGVAERYPHMSYVDIERMFAGPGGSYSPHIAAPDGQLRLARQADGVHITFAGSTWVAAIVWDLIEERWNLAAPSNPTPSDPIPADSPRSNLPR